MTYAIAIIAFGLILIVVGMFRLSAKADQHAEECYLDTAEQRTRNIINTVRRQQFRVLSRNRNLIVGQQVRRRGELVWPWERDVWQGDA